MSTIYKQERGHPNWTGRVPRQSRITGEWSRYVRAEKRIPIRAYFGAAAFVFVLFVVVPYVGAAAGY